jgi:NAD(P)H-flavin reductase
LFLVQGRALADGALTNCEFLLPGRDDPGAAWLQHLPAGAGVHLLGPFGHGFSLDAHSRTLLLITDHGRALPLLPLTDQMLDRGGRVTLLLSENSTQAQENTQMRAALTARLPLAVEVQPVGKDDEWQAALARLLPWADQVCAALPTSRFAELAMCVRQTRFRLDEGYAQMLVEADYACGWGGCLACIVLLGKGGHTRACIHGPVMDLRRLAN